MGSILNSAPYYFGDVGKGASKSRLFTLKKRQQHLNHVAVRMNIHPVAGTETGKGWKFACLSGNVRCDRKEEGNTVLVECLPWGRSAWKCQTPRTKPALWTNTKVLKVAPPPWKPGLMGATNCSHCIGRSLFRPQTGRSPRPAFLNPQKGGAGDPVPNSLSCDRTPDKDTATKAVCMSLLKSRSPD